MKKIIALLFFVVSLMSCLPAFAIDITIIGVSDGGLRYNGRYFATGGTNPYFQTEYISTMSAKGMAGIAVQNSFSGAISTKEQLEVQKGGFGRFETRVSSDTLFNTTNPDTGITTGVYKQPAIGFAGTINSGISLTSFDTTIFKGTAESDYFGTLKAGAMQIVTTGTSEAGSVPKTAEYYKGNWSFGPGQIQGKIEIIFPK